jgi:hypothetical protein
LTLLEMVTGVVSDIALKNPCLVGICSGFYR